MTDLCGYDQLVANSSLLCPFTNKLFRGLVLTEHKQSSSSEQTRRASATNDLLIVSSINEVPSSIIERVQ